MSSDIITHYNKKQSVANRLIVLLVLANFAFVVLNVSVGSVYLSFADIWDALICNDPTNINYKILFKSRMPQSFTALLAGAGLAVCGLQMQTLFRNPLAAPSVLGISSGASLGVALVVMLSSAFGITILSSGLLIGNIAILIAAFCGAMVVLMLIMFFSIRIKNNATLLIIGLMISYITSSVVSVLEFYSSEESVHKFVVWGLGNFSNITNYQLMIFAPIVLFMIVLSIFMSKTLNTLLLGENYAENLGLNVKRARLKIIIVTGVTTAVITAYCGPIAFLGLAVPHLTKLLLPTSDNRILMPSVVLMGALLASICNIVSRMPWSDGTIPVNAVTSLIGAPIVISIIVSSYSKKSI